MAYFALIDENNIVVNVISIPNDQEHRGQDFISLDLGIEGRWLQTSYNTRGGIHYDQNTMTPTGKPGLRKNYAGIGYRYDETLDAFIPPKPFDFPSFVINPQTALWEPPKPQPEFKEGGQWFWIENQQEWVWMEDKEIEDEML